MAIVTSRPNLLTRQRYGLELPAQPVARLLARSQHLGRLQHLNRLETQQLATVDRHPKAHQVRRRRQEPVGSCVAGIIKFGQWGQAIGRIRRESRIVRGRRVGRWVRQQFLEGVGHAERTKYSLIEKRDKWLACGGLYHGTQKHPAKRGIAVLGSGLEQQWFFRKERH